MVNKIAFIGAGSIAEAIISGIIQKGFLKSEQMFVTNKSSHERLKYLKEKYNIQYETNKKRIVENADIIILTVKPNDIKVAVDSFKNYIHSKQLIVSVAAGVSTTDIEKQMNNEIPVIRVMPNTSALIGYSATAISKGKFAGDEHIKLSTQLFNTIGITVVVNERDMDAVTGISGSGPAYIYYLVEAMEKVAIESGLDPQTAKLLINQTVIGAGKMLEKSGESADTLRENVTSPGGTTEAGINTLSEYNFQKAIMNGVKSAISRSIELGKK